MSTDTRAMAMSTGGLPGDLVDELFFKPLCAVLDAEYARRSASP